jgi:hypothetical protein
MKTLHEINEELKAQYGETSLDFTDKGAATGHSYIEFYSKYFEPKRTDVKMLEVGISSGGSALLWSKYFDKFQIDAFDYLPSFASQTPFQPELLATPGVTLTFNKSSFDDAWAKTLPDNYYDFIIDDGDHSIRAQWKTLLNFWPKLAVGGTYFIEDMMDPTAADEICLHLNIYFASINCEYTTETYIGHQRVAEGRLDDVIVAITKK